jgi:hypothetical protein
MLFLWILFAIGGGILAFASFMGIIFSMNEADSLKGFVGSVIGLILSGSLAIYSIIRIIMHIISWIGGMF